MARRFSMHRSTGDRNASRAVEQDFHGNPSDGVMVDRFASPQEEGQVMEGICKVRWSVAPYVLRAITLAIGSGLLTSGSQVRAGAPKVRFDVGQVVECRDVTPAAFSRANPTEKLIEARFRVSVLVTQGRPGDIEEVMVTLVSPKRRLRVVDFSPKTRLATDVLGEVETVESTEAEKSLTASIGGRVAAEYGIGHIEASPSAGMRGLKRNLSKETFRRLPPKTSVLVSGTTHHEYGVFFKLRPFRQESIEGLKEFTCRWVVPASWRGDWAMVTCQARGQSKNLFYTSLKQCGFMEVPIGLYLQGDATAKRMATRLSRGTRRGAAHWHPAAVSSGKMAHAASQAAAATRPPILHPSPHTARKPIVADGFFRGVCWNLPGFDHRSGHPLPCGQTSHEDRSSAKEKATATFAANDMLAATLDALASLSGRGLSAAHPVEP